MSINFIIAQIIGTIALIVLMLSFQKNKKEILLKYQIISSFLYALQYLFLKAYTGSLMNIICAVRNFIFNKYDNKKVPIYWLIIVIFLMITFSLITYIGPISLLPMIAVVLYSVALWGGNLKIVRFVEVISCTFYIIYNINVLAITGLISTIIELLSALVSIYKFDIKTKKYNKYNNLEILVIADCHHLIEDEIEKVNKLKYDICILLGDINGNYLDMILKYIPLQKIYGILGNHDEYGLLESRNITNINTKIININNIKILGFEGSSRYKTGNIPMYSQKESIHIMKKCEKADILVSHDSAYQLYSKSNDKAHCGLKGTTKYLKRNKVYLNIHGHHHINTKLQLKNGTNIIGVYRCALVHFPSLEKKIIF